MGKLQKALVAFINSIPDATLSALPQQSKSNIYSDNDFRLDMQGLTSAKPQKHNLQVQINNQTTISTAKKLAPATVAKYLAPVDPAQSAATVRKGLLDGIMV